MKSAHTHLIHINPDDRLDIYENAMDISLQTREKVDPKADPLTGACSAVLRHG
jgi:hypothetical protein